MIVPAYFRTLPLRIVSGYLRATSCERARWRLVRYALKEVKKCGAAMGHRIITTSHGFEMDLDLSDWVDQHIYATGDYEGFTSLVFRSLLKPGDTVVDVGANIGYFTLLSAQCVGPSGRVIAFEPVGSVRARLRRNVELNGLRNVVVREEAASDTNAVGEIYLGPRDHSGIASLCRTACMHGSQSVRTIRVDDALAPNGAVQLVKIDVEGAEQKALRGMPAALGRWKPHLVVEVTDGYLRAMGSSARELCGELIGLGYCMYAIDWDGLVPSSGELDNLPDQFNALFTLRAALPQALRIKPRWTG